VADREGNAALPQGLPHKDVERGGKVHAQLRKQGIGLRLQI